jgi:dTDP-4-dehydrorhamnose 3,5-epimerase-like enzyme
MTKRVEIDTLRCHRDQRGLVFEPLGPDALIHQGNCHVTLTEPGCVRGNHYHERGHEVTVVLGPGFARYRDGTQIIDRHIQPGELLRFRIPPGIGHAFQNTGDLPMLLLGFNSVPHDPAAPDVVADRLIEV